MNIVYLGCDLFFDCFSDLTKKHRILKLFTFRSDDVYESSARIVSKASELNIPVSYSRIERDEYFSLFEDKGCQLLISAGYPYKIPVRSHDRYRAVNIHPSFLPAGRGNWPIPFAILNDEKNWGVSIHLLSERFDEGDILLQKRFRLSKADTADTILGKCAYNARFMLNELTGRYEFYYQNRKKQTGGEYLRFSEKDITVFKNEPESIVKKKLRAAGKYGIILKE